MPSCSLLHLGFDDKAIIYGVIILLYYFLVVANLIPLSFGFSSLTT